MELLRKRLPVGWAVRSWVCCLRLGYLWIPKKRCWVDPDVCLDSTRRLWAGESGVGLNLHRDERGEIPES